MARGGSALGKSQISVRGSGSLRVTAAGGLRAAVLGGMGLAIISEWMFAPELESGAVRPVLEGWSLPNVDLWAVSPTGRMASAKAGAFADFIESELQGLQRPLAWARLRLVRRGAVACSSQKPSARQHLRAGTSIGPRNSGKLAQPRERNSRRLP
ncbi:LysR substrate-binding domain-containing protein [Mesorhizobium sp. M00.F.Ca.ET.216.01.1.1]|uniref:LysR substrate-binding domain-containing protein n=1 Tax=Mesorhizobium sp. M00.F.Ca.ET.216.01.1.1 TaxID=2500528 RepID=UPI001FE237BA|nr:LysR substrate-binding domain-containing protein [Mesorhizobium sp. M00.F.Ca.ET.216.01.1.1]